MIHPFLLLQRQEYTKVCRFEFQTQDFSSLPYFLSRWMNLELAFRTVFSPVFFLCIVTFFCSSVSMSGTICSVALILLKRVLLYCCIFMLCFTWCRGLRLGGNSIAAENISCCVSCRLPSGFNFKSIICEWGLQALQDSFAYWWYQNFISERVSQIWHNLSHCLSLI